MNAAKTKSQLEDVKGLRVAGIKYLAALEPLRFMRPSMDVWRCKRIYRGWNHPVSARLLCPVERFSDYIADPDG